jgi:hypothetical protein
MISLLALMTALVRKVAYVYLSDRWLLSRIAWHLNATIMSCHKSLSNRCRCEAVSLNENLRLCLIDLADYGFGASFLRAEIDFDRGVFGKGEVCGICGLKNNKQNERKEDR